MISYVTAVMAPFAIHVEFINYRINGAALSNGGWPALYRRRLRIRWKVHISTQVHFGSPIIRFDIRRFKTDLIWWYRDRYAARYVRNCRMACMKRYAQAPGKFTGCLYVNDMINVALRFFKDFSDMSTSAIGTRILWDICNGADRLENF